MKPLTIKRIEVYATGDEQQEKVRWAYYMEPIYTTNIICRIITEDGYEGYGATIAYTENDWDLSIAEALKPYMPGLIGKSAMDRGAIWDWMSNRPNWMPFPTISVIDIALWDLYGKYVDQPLYKLFGAKRDKILSYASTPMLDNDQQYIDYMEDCVEHGFKAIKVHSYCIYDEDIRLLTKIYEHFKDIEVDLLLDVDRQYSREQAYEMCLMLEAWGFGWFEAPLPDNDLDGYKELVSKTKVPISCGGNSLITAAQIQHGINLKCWTDVRADVTVVGGFTPMLKIMALAEANNMRCEIQSWGMTLTQAANLHVMLSHNNCTYFEQAYPYERFETGTKTVLRTNNDGYVQAPEGPGLGIEMDWETIERTTIKKYIYK